MITIPPSNFVCGGGKHNKISHLNDHSQKITEHQAVSKSINKFFSEVGSKLATRFASQSNNEHKRYLDPPTLQSIFLYKTNENEIKDTIKNLKNSNSSRHDYFSARFIKLSAPILIPSLVKTLILLSPLGSIPIT